MATQKESQEKSRVRQISRKMALAYVGAFGVVGDEAGRLFERFVARGEQIEKNVRKMVKRTDKQTRHAAQQVQQEAKANVAKANKTVKKTVKRAEQAIA